MLEEEIQERLEEIQEQKESFEKERDSIYLDMYDKINELDEENKKLSDYSNSLINKLREYEKYPYYNLDFLSAFDVISKSDYRSE